MRPLRGCAPAQVRLTTPQPARHAARWPELAAALRQRVLALEIDGERLEQLLLAELAADLAPAPAGVALASANLAAIGVCARGPAGARGPPAGGFPRGRAERGRVTAGLTPARASRRGGRPLPQGGCFATTARAARPGL